MNGELSNVKKWVILYSVYINSKKIIVEGRRISISKVCENFICSEIVDFCSYFNFFNVIEVFIKILLFYFICF